MGKQIFRWTVALVFLFALLGGVGGQDGQIIAAQARSLVANEDATLKPGVDGLSLPLSFVPNAGQNDPEVRFQAHPLGGTIFFTPAEVVLSLPAAMPQEQAAIVRMQFEAANPATIIEAAERLPGVVNYFVGDDPADWRANLPTYGGILYRRLYEGIDLRYEGNMQALKGTYLVAPGADPDRIRWHYAGVERVQIDPASGDLVITLADKDAGRLTLVEKAPIAWQEINGQHIPVDIHYTLFDQVGHPITHNPSSISPSSISLSSIFHPPSSIFHLPASNSIGFTTGPYDPTQPLIIDPSLVYSALIGGLESEEGRDIAVDSDGNVYLTGSTLSTDFPNAGPPQATYGGAPIGSTFGDAFIAKLNPAGNALIYMTYLGGSSPDMGEAIAIDSQRNVYVTGLTESDDFPTTANAYQEDPVDQSGCPTPPCADAYVTKLNAAGNALVFSTYLSGNREENAVLVDVGTRDTAAGIAVDNAGNVYVTGNTNSTNFPVVNAAFGNVSGLSDLFVTKFQPDGQDVLYSSLIGGTGADRSGDIAVDNAGNAYITGFSLSTNFPTKNALKANKTGPSDAVMAQFDTTKSGNNSHIFSTYFGGSADDFGLGIALDGAGNIYLAGHTTSLDFDTENAYQATNASAGDPIPRDAFLTKFNPAASALLYSTYLGGNDNDVAYGMDLDAQGNVYLTGTTNSDDFPIRDPWQQERSDARDTFVTKLDPTQSGDASLIDSTYFGSPLNDYAYGIAVDGENNPYITGIGSGAVVNDFPIRTEIGPHDSGSGMLVAKFGPRPPQRFIYLPIVIK